MAFPRKMSRLVILTAVVLIVLLVMHFMPDHTPDPVSDKASAKAPAPPERVKTPTAGKEALENAANSRDWSKVPQFHPPKSIKAMPTGKPKAIRRVQASAAAFTTSDTSEARRLAVRDVFKRSYNAYRTYAWMKDEVMPVSAGSKNPFGGWAATLVDGLDTLWIMDLKDEFRVASKAIATIDWSDTEAGAANMFETTIRHLGGLLSAYDLSGDTVLLDKAIELAEMLYHGFDTPNRMPNFWLDFKNARKGSLEAGTNDPSASPGSLCLEFTRLAQITGENKYYDATDRITRFFERTQKTTRLPGMWPISINFRSQTISDSRFTLGALVDSLYEYLPKMYAVMGGVDDTYEKMYRYATKTITSKLLFRPMVPDESDILFTGDWHAGTSPPFTPESQHLTCFVGGMFGLGGRLFDIDEHVKIGEKLARGCGWAYSALPTGIMPEIFGLIPCKSIDSCPWDEAVWKKQGDKNLPKGFSAMRDRKYQLRPEAIESIFVMYRITGSEDLRDMAWDMFQAIVNATETEYAYSAIADVTQKETHKDDSMEVSEF